MAESQPLFMRLPSPAAEELDRMARGTGASKRDVVTRLILGEDLVVGQHHFHPDRERAALTSEQAPDREPAVLTSEQAAELLQVSEQLVVQLADAGQLPGRKLGGDWRFSRAAVLRWLAAEQSTHRCE